MPPRHPAAVVFDAHLGGWPVCLLGIVAGAEGLQHHLRLAHQVVGGIGRAGVVPQERRAYDVADLVERHHPVLLSSHPGVAVSERGSGRVGVVS